MVRYSDDYDSDIDDGLELPDHILRKVFKRDGKKCWLCGHSYAKGLHIAHQVDAAEEEPFARFQANGTLPVSVTDPSHEDNLFPLCSICHTAYHGSFPAWIMIPDLSTLQKYIEHETENYNYRRDLISQSTTPSTSKLLLRTLPIIDKSKILYHPAIISQSLPLDRIYHSHWPKVWLGEPTTVIHRVARRGLLESTPVRPISLGRGRKWQQGVPAMFQVLIGELFRLWARPTPVKGQE